MGLPGMEMLEIWKMHGLVPTLYRPPRAPSRPQSMTPRGRPRGWRSATTATAATPSPSTANPKDAATGKAVKAANGDRPARAHHRVRQPRRERCGHPAGRGRRLRKGAGAARWHRLHRHLEAVEGVPPPRCSPMPTAPRSPSRPARRVLLVPEGPEGDDHLATDEAVRTAAPSPPRWGRSGRRRCRPAAWCQPPRGRAGRPEAPRRRPPAHADAAGRSHQPPRPSAPATSPPSPRPTSRSSGTPGSPSLAASALSTKGP